MSITAIYTKVSNISSLSELLTDEEDFKYLAYGSLAREDGAVIKQKRSLRDMFKVMDTYYQQTQTSSNKSKHFFRSQGAQQKFRLVTQATNGDAADHIFSTALFREIVLAYTEESEYTYDYWYSIKTTLNQCWNFQLITKEDNNRKSIAEKSLVDKLKTSGRQQLELNQYEKSLLDLIHAKLHQTLRKKKFLPQARQVGRAIDQFFVNHGYQSLPLENSWNLPDYKKCTCDLCEYCRSASKRWRYKYYVLYQDPYPAETLPKLVQQSLLQLFFAKTFCDIEIEQRYIEDCKTNQINNLWQLCQILHDMPWLDLHKKMIERQLQTRLRDHLVKVLNRKKKVESVAKAINSYLPVCEKKMRKYLELFLSGEGTKKELVAILKKMQL